MSDSEKKSALSEATDATFQNDVLDVNIPVVVDFYSPTCGPCRFIKPLMEKLATEYDGKVKVVTVNVAEHGEHFFAMGGRGVPLVATFYCGKEVGRKVGSRPYPEFRAMFQSLVELSETEACPATADDTREVSFASAVAEADRVFFSTVAPATERFELETEPDSARFEMAKIDADGKLSRAELSAAEHDQLIQAAIERFKIDTEAAKKRLLAVTEPAEAERSQAIEAARQKFADSIKG